MGHSIQWDNDEHTVVLHQYTEGAQKDDLYLMAKKSAEMLNSVNHTVHLIIDERTVKLTLTSTDMQYLQKLAPKNQGAVMLVIAQDDVAYKKRVQQMGQSFAPNAFADINYFETIEKARAFLVKNHGVKYP